MVANLAGGCVELLAFDIDLVFRVSLESIDFAMVSGLHHLHNKEKKVRNLHYGCGESYEEIRSYH